MEYAETVVMSESESENDRENESEGTNSFE
jgi:hypothetical protein